MKHMKLPALLLALALIFSLAACKPAAADPTGEPSADATETITPTEEPSAEPAETPSPTNDGEAGIRLAVLSGPTGVGANPRFKNIDILYNFLTKEIIQILKPKSTTRQKKMAIGRVIREVDGVLFPDSDEIFKNLGYEAYHNNWELKLFLQIPNITKADILEYFEYSYLDGATRGAEVDSIFCVVIPIKSFTQHFKKTTPNLLTRVNVLIF